MLAKILLACLLAAAALAQPVPDEHDEDIPVYTEKVVPNRPTRAPKSEESLIGGARFSPMKIRAQSDVQSPQVQSDKRPLKRVLKKKPRHIKRMSPKHRLWADYAVLKPIYEPLLEESPQALYDRASVGVRKPPSYAQLAKVVYDGMKESAPEEEDERPAPQEAPKPAPPRRHVSRTVPYEGYAAAPVRQYVAPPAPRHVPPPPPPPPQSHGYDDHGDQYESHPQPYSFGYEVKDHEGASQSRHEVDDGYGNKKGSYAYTDGNGIYRQVEYVADKDGFRATIKTNEPGTKNENPADVQIHSEAAEQSIGHQHY